MNSLFPGPTCSAPFQPLTRLVHLRKWANQRVWMSWLFQAASLWACSSRNTCQAIFPSPADTLRCLICGLCWKTVVSGSTSAPVRLFSLKPSAEDVPHNAFGTHRSQGGKRFEIQFPSFANLVYKPSQPLVKSGFLVYLENRETQWMRGAGDAVTICTSSSTLFFFVVFSPV